MPLLPMGEGAGSLAAQILHAVSPYISSTGVSSTASNSQVGEVVPSSAGVSHPAPPSSLPLTVPQAPPPPPLPRSAASSLLSTPTPLNTPSQGSTSSTVKGSVRLAFGRGQGLEGSSSSGTDQKPALAKGDRGTDSSPGAAVWEKGSPSTTAVGLKSANTPAPASSTGDMPPEKSFDMLNSLFTNWPCVVATVLGFYPSKESPSPGTHTGIDTLSPAPKPRPHPALSPVSVLDSFTTALILNCDESLVNMFVSTIVYRINKTWRESGEGSQPALETLNLSKVDLRSLSEEELVWVVGKRFLNSVIRVLALEHSRVKNSVQELRVTEGGESGLRGGGRERGTASTQRKHITQVAK